MWLQSKKSDRLFYLTYPKNKDLQTGHFYEGLDDMRPDVMKQLVAVNNTNPPFFALMNLMGKKQLNVMIDADLQLATYVHMNPFTQDHTILIRGRDMQNMINNLGDKIDTFDLMDLKMCENKIDYFFDERF